MSTLTKPGSDALNSAKKRRKDDCSDFICDDGWRDDDDEYVYVSSEDGEEEGEEESEEEGEEESEEEGEEESEEESEEEGEDEGEEEGEEEDEEEDEEKSVEKREDGEGEGDQTEHGVSSKVAEAAQTTAKGVVSSKVGKTPDKVAARAGASKAVDKDVCTVKKRVGKRDNDEGDTWRNIDVSDVDPRNVITSRRTRKQTQRYEDTVFSSAEYWKMALSDVPKKELKAALYDEDFSDSEDEEDEGEEEEGEEEEGEEDEGEEDEGEEEEGDEEEGEENEGDEKEVDDEDKCDRATNKNGQNLKRPQRASTAHNAPPKCS